MNQHTEQVLSAPVWSPAKISFALMALLLGLAIYLHLGTPLLTILFSSFVLRKLNFGGRKWLALTLFLVVVCLIFFGFAKFIQHAARSLPDVADESIPKVIDFALNFAKERDIELPFHDLPSLKSKIKEEITDNLSYLTNFAKLATKEFVFLVIGIVVAASMFLRPTLDLDPGKHPVANNLYSRCCDALVERFKNFYLSFETVMGAQIMISIINTVLTAIFISWTALKYKVLLVGVTFLCGLLPIIGNILSNCVIVGVGFTISPTLALSALAFLVVLHKLEYFLNSKIIGDRIRNPVWLTLISLVVGEKIMGIPGMILAPVILFYLKLETGRIPCSVAARPGPSGA